MCVMETALLAAGYFLRLCAWIIAAYGCGGLLVRPRPTELPTGTAILLRLIHGFGVIGLAALLLGFVGAISGNSLRAIFGLGLLLGCWSLLRTRPWENYLPVNPPATGRLSWLHSLLIAASALCALNVIVGALAPDSAQDSLWYHLACARAWIHWHRPLAWPTVYPSCFSLHGSLLYSVALAIGDEIDCSLLYALFGFLGLAIVSLYALEWWGLRAAVWAWFLCATAYATYFWFVPVNAGSDLTSVMFSSAGVLAALDALNRPASSPRRALQWRYAAWLLGWGSTVKLPVAGYALFPILALSLLLWARARLRRLGRRTVSDVAPADPSLREVVLFGVLAAIPLALWGARSLFFGAGNPLYPLFREWIPLKPEFLITRRNPIMNTMFPFSLRGVAIVIGLFPRKLRYLVTAHSSGFVLHAAVMLAAPFVADRRWRMFAFLAIIQWAVYFWTSGYNETVKYLAACFPVAFVFAAEALAVFERMPQVRPAARNAALVAFAAILFATYAQRQIEWGSYESVRWEYRPILRHEDRLHYLSTKSYQLNNIFLYDAANRLLPRDAVVLFPDNTYPFYVDRAYLWVDDDIDFYRYLEELGVENAGDLALYLADRHVTHVIANPRNIARHPVWTAVLDPNPTTAPLASAQLYKVRRQPSAR